MGSRSKRTVLYGYKPWGGPMRAGFDFNLTNTYYSYDGGKTWHMGPHTKPEPPYAKWAKEDLLKVPRNRRVRRCRGHTQDKYRNRRENRWRPAKSLVLGTRPGRIGHRGRRNRRRP